MTRPLFPSEEEASELSNGWGRRAGLRKHNSRGEGAVSACPGTGGRSRQGDGGWVRVPGRKAGGGRRLSGRTPGAGAGPGGGGCLGAPQGLEQDEEEAAVWAHPRGWSRTRRRQLAGRTPGAGAGRGGGWLAVSGLELGVGEEHSVGGAGTPGAAGVVGLGQPAGGCLSRLPELGEAGEWGGGRPLHAEAGGRCRSRYHGLSSRRTMTVYTLNLRVFWPLVTCLCTALVCLYQAVRSRAGAPDSDSAPDSGSVPLLKGSALLLLGFLLLRYCASRSGGGECGQRPRAACCPEAPPSSAARRSLLESFYEQQLRLSPHVLGHSKAHVSRIVGELVRAAKAQGLQPGSLTPTLRGDFVQIGSAYEQHKVRSPDCFDILVPLRLPPRLELEPRCLGAEEPGLAPELRSAFTCALKVPQGAAWPRGYRPFSEGFCVELQGRRYLSSALVLRWFQGHLQRCLGAVLYRLQERCRISLAACPGRQLTLHILPRSDYVCCHISMAVRLIPAIPLGDSVYLIALQPGARKAQPGTACPLQALWGLNVSKQEQRLLSWLKEQTPANSCHLKCLQLLKGLRDLRGRGLEQPFGAQWSRVLSSYILKTALFSLLLRGPWQAWEEQFLAERVEDLVLYLRDCLQKRVLMHFFLGNANVPEAVPVPKLLKEAAPVNLLAAFDAPTLDLAAFQLLNTWNQAPKIIRMYSSPRYLRKSPTLCKHITDTGQESQSN
ncbi:inositol 1,4,5-trisphosphate receptor-interacting protein-like 2 [Malaclemys terrapin pileata]|uniref:inositol 1,4,5-trisphosphate receptor-interacting protein-like 2 n=1 Tax=Malaclemys terrapin pileata TaxID=2991368 RepID=UPI0023A8765D|nr:inositol 1,4,5-trisphosphate receptor-interacting protein-like 2 [Malaclemys terrapin pileata]